VPPLQHRLVVPLPKRPDGLTEATVRMLQAAAPGACGGSHPFQVKVTGALAGIFKDVETRETATAAAAESRAAEATAERSEASKANEATHEKVTAAQEVRDMRNTALDEAATGLAAAKEELQTMCTKQAGLQAEHERAVADRTEHESLVKEAWEPLKAGEVTGKQWREKNRMIARVMTVMEQIGIEESLRSSLPMALKSQLKERGDFANKAISFCDGELQEQLASLVQKIDSHDGEVNHCADAVKANEETVQAADGLHQNKQGELSTAEGELTEAKQVHMTAVKTTEALSAKETELSDVMGKAKAELEGVSALLARFESLCKTGAQEASAEETEQQ